ncbi:MAG: pyrimidine 5'-nucleotidase [Nitratireductor sp.]
MQSLTHITDWVFDLDNTLYPRHCDLFSQIDWKMTAYVERLTGLDEEEARALQKQLYKEHGTTLNGLMAEYNIDAHDFLADVHDIDYSKVEYNPKLGDLIMDLPGRKHIYTNGDVPHAENTLRAIGIEPIFDTIFGIVEADFHPKPAHYGYEKFLSEAGIDPEAAAMFEDMPRNLEVPNEFGMSTVLIQPRKGTKFAAESWELAGADGEHIDFTTDDIDLFLKKVLSTLG